MKLTTSNYEIEYKDSYINGIVVDWFDVKFGDVIISIEYSRDKKEIISHSVDKHERIDYDNEEHGFEIIEALDAFKFAKYEIKAVCSFMLDLM